MQAPKMMPPICIKDPRLEQANANAIETTPYIIANTLAATVSFSGEIP